MQETQYQGRVIQEFFTALTDADVNKKMDNRFKVLEAKGHTFVRRIKIGRNDKCPCSSGLKFKKCCIDKVKGAL